jgi:cytochrome b
MVLMMQKKFTYDIPIRLFHWVFAALFVVAFTIANTVDDESLVFSYHMLAGMILCFTVVWRIAWGFFGTTYSRFSGFALKPKDLLCYLQGIVTGDKRRWVGHNPASSWAALMMFTFVLGLGVTGYLMSAGIGSEVAEDLHEVLANGFLIVALLHIVGIVLHTMRHKDEIWKSMFSGYKQGVAQEEINVKSRPAAGLAFIALTLGFSFYLFQNFESNTKKLSFFGSSITLGEFDDEEHDNSERKGSKEDRKRHKTHDD